MTWLHERSVSIVGFQLGWKDVMKGVLGPKNEWQNGRENPAIYMLNNNSKPSKVTKEAAKELRLLFLRLASRRRRTCRTKQGKNPAMDAAAGWHNQRTTDDKSPYQRRYSKPTKRYSFYQRCRSTTRNIQCCTVQVVRKNYLSRLGRLSPRFINGFNRAPCFLLAW